MAVGPAASIRVVVHGSLEDAEPLVPVDEGAGVVRVGSLLLAGAALDVAVGVGVVNENWSEVAGRLLLGSREVAEALVEAPVRVANVADVLDESAEAVVPVALGVGVVCVKSSVLLWVGVVCVKSSVLLGVRVVNVKSSVVLWIGLVDVRSSVLVEDSVRVVKESEVLLTVSTDVSVDEGVGVVNVKSSVVLGVGVVWVKSSVLVDDSVRVVKDSEVLLVVSTEVSVVLGVGVV